jgi:hypothetical protein
VKRILFWIFVVVVFIAIAAFITSLRNRNGRFPRFVAGAPASIPQFKFVEYEWSTDAPFQNDRLWLWVAATNGPRCYLYDLKNRAVAGQLFDAATVGIYSRDGSRLLVRGPGSPSFQQEISDIVAKLFGRKIGSARRAEAYWVLDISRNVATKVGQFSQIQGAGSRWHASPDFRHAFNMPSTSFGSSFFVCDLDNVWMARFDIKGDLRGWWDDSHILLESKPEGFTLFDVQTEKTTPLFTQADVQPLLARAGITNTPDLSADVHWNGTNYDLYFGLSDKIRGLHGDSFLLKANRSGPPLTMVSTNFGFRWGGSFNETSGLYLFQGESGRPGSGGNGSVYVRNLTNGTETVIVPPDNKGQYAIPRFYGNEVIYFRDRVLHRIGLDGSNDSLVLTNVISATNSAH